MTPPSGKSQPALKTVTGTAAKVQRNPVIAHLLRAAERFNDRLGNQFGAAITYFSFLSMIPILMVSFAAAGFVLAGTQPCCRTFSTKFCKTSATQRWRQR